MADEPDATCLCDHPESQHRARPINGRWYDPCQVMVCECTVFVEAEASSTLLYAWNALLCEQCDFRTSAPDLLARPDFRCLQCGAELAPVRMEMHSREPG